MRSRGVDEKWGEEEKRLKRIAGWCVVGSTGVVLRPGTLVGCGRVHVVGGWSGIEDLFVSLVQINVRSEERSGWG